jgi:hypothetical protein
MASSVVREPESELYSVIYSGIEAGPGAPAALLTQLFCSAVGEACPRAARAAQNRSVSDAPGGAELPIDRADMGIYGDSGIN